MAKQMTRHDRCMLDTLFLEARLFSQYSPSVLSHVLRLDGAHDRSPRRRWWSRALAKAAPGQTPPHQD